MRIILLGGPGAGKGTQGDYICARLGLQKISTGDMLRAAVEAGTATGLEVQEVMETGGLVSDDLILTLVTERIGQPDCASGYLLDGFPRTLVQARGIEVAGIDINWVLEIDVTDDDIVRRLSGRRVHQASGRTYHVDFNPPRRTGYDDVTGEALVEREDDGEQTVRNRLAVYHSQTQPLVEFYKDKERKMAGGFRYVRVDGSGDVESVRDVIRTVLQG